MAKAIRKREALLQELITRAHSLNVEVRTEKLFREVGYHARGGRCRLNGKELIIIDRDIPLGDRVEFLLAELAQFQSENPHAERQPDKDRVI